VAHRGGLDLDVLRGALQPLHDRLLAEEHAEHDRRQALSPGERTTDARSQVLLLDDLP